MAEFHLIKTTTFATIVHVTGFEWWVYVKVTDSKLESAMQDSLVKSCGFLCGIGITHVRNCVSYDFSAPPTHH